jgi:gliding motility-associated lipoprotein GldH
MDDLFDHRVLLYRDAVKFSKPGEYTIRISHDMRVEPLEGVLNMGLRIEKVK